MSKILIVEDEPSIAENITYVLGTDGFTPVWCATGGEARKNLADGNVDLVILDVGLPDVSGFELCKEIRKTSSVPILFLTARSEEIDRVVGLEIGGDDYVIKPFSPRELSARVKAILRRTGSTDREPLPETEAAHEADQPFVIDDEKLVITYFSHPLDLSRYEFRLLKILMEKPGRVYTREQLMNRAWDEPEASLDRTVDAHVKSIRAKLKAVKPDRDPIRTHRGVGYSLKEQF